MASGVRGTFSSTALGAVRRCPSCRRGRMYRSFYELHERCPLCGYSFQPSPGEFTGGLMLAQGILGILAVAGFIVLRVRGASTTWQYAWLGLVLVVVPIVLYPNIKGAWLGFLFGVRGPR